jgi:hypothetical protein
MVWQEKDEWGWIVCRTIKASDSRDDNVNDMSMCAGAFPVTFPKCVAAAGYGKKRTNGDGLCAGPLKRPTGVTIVSMVHYCMSMCAGAFSMTSPKFAAAAWNGKKKTNGDRSCMYSNKKLNSLL